MIKERVNLLFSESSPRFHYGLVTTSATPTTTKTISPTIKPTRGNEKELTTRSYYNPDPFGEKINIVEDPKPSRLEQWCHRIRERLDPTEWLLTAADYDFVKHVEGEERKQQQQQQKRWALAPLVRHFVYDPMNPEFTEIQQTTWAVIIGIWMGIYTFLWKQLIEKGVIMVWETIPTVLYRLGVFADHTIPLYHYMWICPAFMGGVLSYVFAKLDIPDQGAWIKGVHTRGVVPHHGYWGLFVLSTLGMYSGLSLGPELPLVLTGGMFGSAVALLCNQSILQSRILTLTAASAAVGGFFRLPLAGALFVLELPHRMGLEYSEALGPAVLASIVSVLVSCGLSGENVAGYFTYPDVHMASGFLVLVSTVFLGVYGCGVGIVYAEIIKIAKSFVHNLFAAPDDHVYNYLHRDNNRLPAFNINIFADDENDQAEFSTAGSDIVPPRCCGDIFVIPSKAWRAAVAGTLVGAAVGVIGIFIPHSMFWGEAQLQNLIDRGLSPLPVFTTLEDDPTSTFLSHGFCLVDASNKEGIGMGCALLIAAAKTVTIGLSLGTGIIGGQFWGPLYVGCALAHVLTDVVDMVTPYLTVFGFLTANPTIVILCVMGSAHVVTFRAWMAIPMILTLTMSDGNLIICLLVVAVYLARTLSGSIPFYTMQRSRHDIVGAPELMCQPGKPGTTLVPGYESITETCTITDYSIEQDIWEESIKMESTRSLPSRPSKNLVTVTTHGEVSDKNLSLLEQARTRSASLISGGESSYSGFGKWSPSSPEQHRSRRSTSSFDSTLSDVTNEATTLPKNPIHFTFDC